MKPSLTTMAQKLTRARVQLLLAQPFFGTLSLRLKLDTWRSAHDGDGRRADCL